MLYAREDMCLRLVLIPQLNKTFLGGLCQKLVDPIMTQRSLIEIRLMTQGHPLVNNATLKIHQLEQLILDLLAEKLHKDWEPSRIRWLEGQVSNYTILSGDSYPQDY
jgi:hypothetical protein